MLAPGMLVATAHKAVSALQTMQYLYSRGVPRETAMYAVAMAKKTDPESSDPTYIIVEWCAT